MLRLDCANGLVVCCDIFKKDGISVFVEILVGRFMFRTGCMRHNVTLLSADDTAHSTKMMPLSLLIAFRAVNISLEITPRL